VIVAGAGPAGIATAVALVREQGLPPQRLVVLDRALFPRPKPCGGGLTGHATEALEALGLALRVPTISCAAGVLHYGRARRRVPLPRPVRVARREDLDADLVQQARDLGIEVREGVGLQGFSVRSGQPEVVAHTTGGALCARVLVGAEGAGSLVRRHLLSGTPWQRQRPLRLARLEVPAASGSGNDMVYDFTPLRDGLRGYVWLFPSPGGRLNVGVMHYPSRELGGRALDALLAEALLPHGVRLAGPARGWPAWGYHPDSPVAAPHLLCVGDAAGIDALTGEGIAVGLAHGRLAARAIACGLARGDLSFAGYRAALRRAVVGRELALDRWLARMLHGAGDPRPWLALVMEDAGLRELYAARVAGGLVLADQKRALLEALGRHLFLGTRRVATLESASAL